MALTALNGVPAVSARLVGQLQPLIPVSPQAARQVAWKLSYVRLLMNIEERKREGGRKERKKKKRKHSIEPTENAM